MNITFSPRALVKIYKGVFSTLLFVTLVGCSVESESSRSTSGLATVIMLIMFVASLVAGAVPLLGIRTHTNLLRWATSLAAGFLISSALLVALPEGFHLVSKNENDNHILHADESAGHGENQNEVEAHQHNAKHPVHRSFGFGAFQTAGLALLAGFMLMLVVESMGFGHDLHEEHHHEDSEKDHIHHPARDISRRKGLATPIVIGLSIHALTDGLAMGAALSTDSMSLTVPLMLGIVMHKMPAAFSLSAFSQHSHGNVRRTWKALFVFSLATPVALFIAWRILGAMESYWLGLAVLASAGTLLYVATVDVLPNVIHGANRKTVFLQVAIGTAVILALLLVLESLGLGVHPH